MGRRSVWLSVVLVLIAGCAQLQTKVPEDVEFDLSGRLAARYGKDGFTGNIAWRHARSADEMLITSALGAGTQPPKDAEAIEQTSTRAIDRIWILMDVQ